MTNYLYETEQMIKKMIDDVLGEKEYKIKNIRKNEDNYEYKSKRIKKMEKIYGGENFMNKRKK